MAKASEDEIRDAMSALPQWEIEGNGIERSFEFADFAQAWAFMGKVAQAAEEMNHHPEWSNVYNSFEIYLSTHDADGVTEKDFELAKIIDNLIG